MKKAEIQDLLLWKGKLSEVTSKTDSPTINIERMGNCYCPHCDGIIEKRSESVVVESRYFQENAEAVKTISEK